MSYFRYLRPILAVLVLTSYINPASAQNSAGGQWKYVRLGIGYEWVNDGPVLGKVLTHPDGSAPTIGNKLPASCFAPPGVSKTSRSAQASMRFVIDRVNDRKVSIECSGSQVQVTVLPEVTRDGRTWFLAKRFDDLIYNSLLFDVASYFAFVKNGHRNGPGKAVLRPGPTTEIMVNGRRRDLGVFVSKGSVYAVVDTDSASDQALFIQKLRAEGRTASAQSGDSVSAYRTSVLLGPASNLKTMNDYMQAGLRLVSQQLGLSINKMEREFSREPRH